MSNVDAVSPSQPTKASVERRKLPQRAPENILMLSRHDKMHPVAMFFRSLVHI